VELSDPTEYGKEDRITSELGDTLGLVVSIDVELKLSEQFLQLFRQQVQLTIGGDAVGAADPAVSGQILIHILPFVNRSSSLIPMFNRLKVNIRTRRARLYDSPHRGLRNN